MSSMSKRWRDMSAVCKNSIQSMYAGVFHGRSRSWIGHWCVATEVGRVASSRSRMRGSQSGKRKEVWFLPIPLRPLITALHRMHQITHLTTLNPKHRVNPQSIALHKIQMYPKNGLPSTHQMIDDFHTFVVRIYADFLDWKAETADFILFRIRMVRGASL